jgi:hypothetical protein
MEQELEIEIVWCLSTGAASRVRMATWNSAEQRMMDVASELPWFLAV